VSASGSPWLVPLADVRVDDELVSAATSTLESGWWSMGPRVSEFEGAFAARLGTAHAVAVANGTAALHLALLAAGCGSGDEVILPSLNFVAAANTIVRANGVPVFCDIVGDTDLNLDPDDVEAAITPRTKYLLVLHYGGVPCDMDRLTEIAARRGLTIIEDAAHAPGATTSGRPCGTLGAAGCFSFFSNKNMPVGEGGMVVTGDDELAASLRLLRSHGMTALTWDRHRGHASGYDVVEHGFNYRLDEVRAAVGLVMLERLDAENAARRRLAALYRQRLDGVDGLVVPFANRDPVESAHHLAVVLLPDDISRNDVQATLREERIQTSVHYPPIHSFSAYRELGARRALPRTDAVAERLLTLPLFGHLTDEQVELVCDRLVTAVHAVRQAA
jgi:dTDP-4-amino-4,6-dideoxygalactose transaminase